MQPLSNILAGGLLLAALLAAPSGPGGAAAQCTGDDIAKAVNDAGRRPAQALARENTPRLQAKMRELKAKKKWPDAGYEERAYQELADERMAALDANANTLLARIDALGTLEPGAAPECGRLEQLQAASLELQATVKTKTAYLVTRIDQMLSDAPVPTLSKAKPAETKAEVKPDATQGQAGANQDGGEAGLEGRVQGGRDRSSPGTEAAGCQRLVDQDHGRLA